MFAGWFHLVGHIGVVSVVEIVHAEFEGASEWPPTNGSVPNERSCAHIWIWEHHTDSWNREKQLHILHIISMFKQQQKLLGQMWMLQTLTQRRLEQRNIDQMERFRLYIWVHLVTGIILFVFDYKSCQIVGSKFPVWFNEIFSAGFFSMQLAFASKSSLHCCTSIVGGRTTETKRFEALLKYQCKCHGMHGGRRMHPITDHT